MDAITWANRREPAPYIRISKNHIAASSGAVKNLPKHIDIGITNDGVIVVRPGDTYTISTYTTGKRSNRGRIGGRALHQKLISEGALMGNYKMVYNKLRKIWEGYYQDGSRPKQPSKAKRV